ncbi:MAG: MBL fold metallo-hydrolase [Oscillochloris sp.]|nr:MBL fold metallo-hydrolase [Oscillochloris sp.]
MSVRAIMPGVNAIETTMGNNLLRCYLLSGARTLLVDSGLRTMPDTVIFPALEATGLPLHFDMLLNSHADADHHGGNAAILARSPGSLVLCHALDAPRVESRERHLRERYTAAVAADDTPYSAAIMDWLADGIGADMPVDLTLLGDERINLGPGATWQVLHAPGHTPGHLALWNAEHGVLIIQDAVLGGMGVEPDGAIGSPPPYFAVDTYLATIKRLRSLGAALLLSAHIPIMNGTEAVTAFFDASAQFVADLDSLTLEVLQAAGTPQTLAALCAAVDKRLGPSSTPIQWIPPVRAHLERHAAAGRLQAIHAVGARTWMS